MRVGVVRTELSIDVSSFSMAFVWSGATVNFNWTNAFDFSVGVTRDRALARTWLPCHARSPRNANIFFFTTHSYEQSRTEKLGF